MPDEIRELFHTIWNLHFEEIKRRCRCKLCSADQRIGYEEELASDVMLGIWRELTSKSHRNFVSKEDIWIAILRLIEERAIDRAKYLKRKRRRCPSEIEPLFEGSAVTGASASATLQLEATETWQILIHLARSREFLELLRLRRDGVEAREIANELHLSVRSIQRKIQRLHTIYQSMVR